MSLYLLPRKMPEPLSERRQSRHGANRFRSYYLDGSVRLVENR
jgi:hypothetical protein